MRTVNVEKPVEPLKICIRRAVKTAKPLTSPTIATETGITPASQTESLAAVVPAAKSDISSSAPAPKLQYAPAKRGRPRKSGTPSATPAATFISASAPSPAVKMAPAKRGRPSIAGTSSTSPAATFEEPPAKRFRPIKVVAASAPAQVTEVGILPVKAKAGRPKKATRFQTSITFKSEPVEDANSERIQARSEAYWRDHQGKPGHNPKTDTPGLTSDAQPAASIPTSAPATRQKRVQATNKATDKFPDKEPLSTASKIVSFWYEQAAKVDLNKPKKRVNARKARGA
ncbi:hypothetical protein PtB15_14B231 [Puccinia triticina]|nr:hypothetical protein PtB15_14B231 [Puccinia triticina]